MSTSSRSTRRKEQAAFWRLAIETWQSSNMSVSQFCRTEGLSGSFLTITGWRKKLAGIFGRRQQTLTDESVDLLASHQAQQPERHPYVFIPPARYDFIQKLREQGAGDSASIWKSNTYEWAQ